jgi:hypothetical protein
LPAAFYFVGAASAFSHLRNALSAQEHHHCPNERMRAK